MPREISNSSIKTIWENNPDTPLTATNLSKALDLIASYKDYKVEEGDQPLHKEYSLLTINPEDNSQLLFKRGSVLQVINEATDDSGEPVVPINEHYKIFDVGLDDIILTSNETDRSLEGDKSAWGSNGETKKWFVFLCDKDDSTVYSKGTDSEYGGGAQIVISNSNDKPQNYAVPGRPYDLYTEKDTRIIGGFKTYNNTITEVWDISGRYHSVKSKDGYYILDEYSDEDDYDYRRIDVRDLNTDRNSVFEGSITVNQNSNLIGGLDLSGTVQINSNNFKIDSTLGNASLHLTDTGDGLVDIKSNLSVEGNINFASSDFTIVGDVKHYGSFIERDGDFDIEGKIIHKGNLEMIGDIDQSGTVTMGGSDENLSSEGTWSHSGEFRHFGEYIIDGAVRVSGSYSLVSDDLEFRAFTHKGWDDETDSPIYHAFQIRVQNPMDSDDERTSSNADRSIYTYHQGKMEVNGATWSHSENASFSINWGGDHKMIAYSKGFEYSDQGDGPSGGYKITSDLIVQNDSSNVLLNVKRLEREVYITGNTDVHLKDDDDTFTVSDDSGSIITVQKDPRKFIVSGNMEVEAGKTITASYLDGNAKTATDFENLLTFNFDSSDSDMSSGSVEFSGSEETITVDLIIDRDKWYNIEDFDDGVLDRRYYTETEMNPSTASGPAVIQGDVDFSADGVLDLRYYTEQELDDRLGGEDGVHWSVLTNRPTYTLQEELKDGDTSNAINIDLSEDDDYTFTLDINPDGHEHGDIYYKEESDLRFYTKEDLSTPSGDFNDGLIPTIHWDVLTNAPFSETGAKKSISREDHIHSFGLDLYEHNLSFGENVSLNLSNSYSKLDFLDPYSTLGIENIQDLNIEEDYLIFESYNGLIKFWFKDDDFNDGAGNTEPSSSEELYSSVPINVTGIEDLVALVDTMNSVIGARDEFSSTTENNTLIVNYEAGSDNFTPNFVDYPYSSNTNFIVIGINSFNEYGLNLMVDDLISGTNHIEEGDNYILTRDLHDELIHKVLGTNKENLLLDSSVIDFEGITVSEDNHPINTVYAEVKTLARPGTHNDNSRQIVDKVGIHVNNIYIPDGFDPYADDPTSVQSYLNVTSTFDSEGGVVTEYDITDVPLLQYLDEHYPTRDELGGTNGSVSLSDQYYLKEVINPANDGSETTDRVNTDWDLFAGLLDYRYYNIDEINPGDGPHPAGINDTAADFSVSTPLDLRYYNRRDLDPDPSANNVLDSRYYTETEIDNKLADKDNYNLWSVNVDGSSTEVGSEESVRFNSGTNIDIDFTAGGHEMTINSGTFDITEVIFEPSAPADSENMTLSITQNDGLNGTITETVNLGHNHSDIYYTKDQLENSGVLDDRYYTETELETSGSSSINLGNLNHTENTTIDLDSGDLNWEFSQDNRMFSVRESTNGNVSFEVVNRDTTGGGYTSIGGYINMYASERLRHISDNDIQIINGPSDVSSINASILISNGEINFGDNRGAGYNDYTLTDDSNTSIESGATSIVGGINEAYNNLPTHDHDEVYYTETEVGDMTDTLVDSIVKTINAAYQTPSPSAPTSGSLMKVEINTSSADTDIAWNFADTLGGEAGSELDVSNSGSAVIFEYLNDHTQPPSTPESVGVPLDGGISEILPTKATSEIKLTSVPDDGDYFVLYEPNGTSHAFWYDTVDSGSSYDNDHEIDLGGLSDTSQAAEKTRDTVNGTGPFSATLGGNEVRITWEEAGRVEAVEIYSSDIEENVYDRGSNYAYKITFQDDSASNNGNYNGGYIDITMHDNSVYRLWFDNKLSITNPFTNETFT